MRRPHILAFAVLVAACSGHPSTSIAGGPGLSPGSTSGAAGSGGANGRCRTADLRISVTNTEAAAGGVGGYLMFENTTSAPCALQGAPTLTAATATGAVTQARVATAVGTPFPSLSQPPLVVLQPGDRAFAAYGGTDNPGSGGLTCPPPFQTFRVAPPGDPIGVDLRAFNAWLGQDQPACVGIAVTVIASASAVAQVTDLSSLRP